MLTPRRKEERRAAVVSGPVTIDVDAVWAQMLAGKTTTTETPATATADEPEAQAAPEPAPAAAPTADLVRIRRTYNFAGKTHTEEKMVPRDSAEARLYFESEEGRKSANAAGGADSLPEGRVTKRAFRSAFEPVFAIVDPTAAAGAGARRTDLNLSVAARLQAGREGQAARKLNTVEKSRMDWAGFVDREGIKDELDMAGRAKDSYAARQDFLARSEARREEEAYKARVGAR